MMLSTSDKITKKKLRSPNKIKKGDVIRLTQGRIGEIRFIGSTKFGLGEWIGVQIYNDLIETRHNGQVDGIRYFRCPANKGLFIRREIIIENIRGLQIKKSVKDLKHKEKALKLQLSSSDSSDEDYDSLSEDVAIFRELLVAERKFKYFNLSMKLRRLLNDNKR